ncbi:O-antigen ligase family protein [Nitrosospira briensis]|uniref:O-antigen ligase family protein n=1 Tax=Nitrosospira briensis TaxID=35799 RepID=UPI0008EE3939|nr:O-antigen ligase family protein [Nitrosospira briensis]SFN73033.1 O-antigen ligase [Nitrosospira briensis]
MSTFRTSAGLSQSGFTWRDLLAKSALLFFGIALWHKGLSFYGYYLLPLAWILDGGLGRFRQIMNEPLVVALLVLCFVLALGILWSEYPALGFKVWRRYFAFLVFIPYLSLLNKERLPWAICGLLTGYFGALIIGVYQWVILGVQGIPPLGMPYTSFSSTLGIGIILALYFAGTGKSRKVRLLLWLLAISLLFIQFNQGGRGALLATLFSSLLLLFLLYKAAIKTLLIVMASLIAVIAAFAYNSDSFHERLAKAENDIQLARAGTYSTSLGYRLAIWDVGLHGIAERPIFGHGTGMGASYFDKTVETYKEGIYKDLPQFLTTYHYHSDWIEIGINIGALGFAAYAFFLWSWFKTLRAHCLAVLGGAFVCFIFLSGLTDTLVFFRQTFYLLLVVTATAVGWHKAHGAVFLST